MKWLPVFLLVTCFFLFWPSYKVVENPHELKILPDGCVVYSLHHKMAMEANEMLMPYLWSRVLAIHFYGKVGHAVNVFVYKNHTFVYDPGTGTYPIYERPIYDPLQLAEIMYPDTPIRRANFLEPTFLLQYQTESLQVDTSAFIIE
jgi:hypothetical protein